jgi:23S rRNA (adenine2503-C2)-methyltransferase
MKEPLLGKTLKELELVSESLQLPKFTAKQIAQWLYQKNISSIDEMTNLSKDARHKLNESYGLGIQKFSDAQKSVDGTKKYLFPVSDTKYVEAAYIPDEKRNTLCVSSQVGCKMGCLFCMTGKQGFQAQLTAGQIVNQIRSLPERDKLTNIVYMGMGEPFDNIDEVLKSLELLTAPYGMGFTNKKVTVSTIGIIPGMQQFLENSEAHLAVSLHTPFDDERKKLMPVENVYPIKEVVNELEQFDFGKQRRISFEYIMFKDVNDSKRHVNELARLLNKLKCRINLIRFHPIPDTPLLGSDDETIFEFKEALEKKGITTTIRASRGQDIYAACGLLSTKKFIKEQEKDF